MAHFRVASSFTVSLVLSLSGVACGSGASPPLMESLSLESTVLPLEDRKTEGLELLVSDCDGCPARMKLDEQVIKELVFLKEAGSGEDVPFDFVDLRTEEQKQSPASLHLGIVPQSPLESKWYALGLETNERVEFPNLLVYPALRGTWQGKQAELFHGGDFPTVVLVNRSQRTGERHTVGVMFNREVVWSPSSLQVQVGGNECTFVTPVQGIGDIVPGMLLKGLDFDCGGEPRDELSRETLQVVLGEGLVAKTGDEEHQVRWLDGSLGAKDFAYDAASNTGLTFREWRTKELINAAP